MKRKLLCTLVVTVLMIVVTGCGGSLDNGIVHTESGSEISLGSKIEDVEAQFTASVPDDWGVYYDGVYVQYDGEIVMSIHLVSDFADEKWRSASGIGIGSSSSEVREAYGKPDEVVAETLWVYKNNKVRLQVQMGEDRVAEMVISKPLENT